jgi:hypothetical protein
MHILYFENPIHQLYIVGFGFLRFVDVEYMFCLKDTYYNQRVDLYELGSLSYLFGGINAIESGFIKFRLKTKSSLT